MTNLSPRLLLLAVSPESPETCQTMSVTPDATAGPVAIPIGQTERPSQPFDVVILSLPAGAAVLATLEHVRRYVASDGALVVAGRGLRSAAVECFPPGSPEIVLGAAGFALLPNASVDLAGLLARVPAVARDAWRARLGVDLTAALQQELLIARPGPALSFVTPSVDDAVLAGNLLRSRAVTSGHNELLIERRGPHVQAALNSGLARAANDLIVVAHEDVYLPPLWEGMFRRALRLVEAADCGWGVLGCAGVRRKRGLWRVRRRGVGHSQDHATTWGHPFDAPEVVDTLDEFLIAFRRSRGLHFDEQQPNYHFYAVDLCLQAASRDMRCYAIEAFCHHNSRAKHDRRAAPPPDFLAGCEYLRHKWADRLPIVTTCTVIARDPAHDHHARRLRGRWISRYGLRRRNV